MSTQALATQIVGTGSVTPGRSVSTEEVCAAAYPGRDPEELRARTGIDSRWWAAPSDTRASVSARALELALADAGLAAAELERLIYVDSTGGDRRVPATANAVAEALGLAGTCDCIDLNNACTGFLSAMDWAARGTATGMGPTAVVATELWSKVIHASEPRPFAVFGDASAAAIFAPVAESVTGGRPGAGLCSIWLRNDGHLRGSVDMRHGLDSDEPGYVRFLASNKQIIIEATDALVLAVDRALAQAELGIEDIDWFLPHQPNGRMVSALLERLSFDADQTVPITREMGSVSAASIPTSLDRLRRSGRLRPGHKLLFAAVGAGIGYGAAVYREGPEQSPPQTTRGEASS